MSDETKLSAQLREEQGSQNSRRMRRAGSVPAALNDTKGNTTLIKLDEHELNVLMQHHHNNEGLLLSLSIEGRGDVMAQMVEVQHHVVNSRVLHVDFTEISMTEKMTAQITINLVGIPEGVKTDGGLLDQHLYSVEVSCMPGDLVEEIDLDVTALELTESLYVKDLSLGDKFDVLSDADQVVANVVPPHAEAEEDEEAEEGGDLEPEVIGAKKEEEE